MTDIVSETDGAVLRIAFNCPERGNSASDEMVVQLTNLIVGATDEIDLIVLRGVGDDFCLGRARMGVRQTTEPEALARRDTTEIVFNLYRSIRDSRVPVLCGVQGRAIGFGCAVAAICDITLAAVDARFSTPEMAHGVLPTVVMSTFVDRVPRKALQYLIYSSAEVSAERALSFGIVSEIVPNGRLDNAMDDLCKAILEAPSIAIRGAKEYMRTAADMPVNGAVDFARNLHATINSSHRMRERRV